MSKQEWNMQALREALDEDLQACHTENERINCRAISGIGIRKRADELHAQGRLTPGGRAIAEEFGWRRS